jgi:hypothetical protein
VGVGVADGTRLEEARSGALTLAHRHTGGVARGRTADTTANPAVNANRRGHV